MESTKVQKCAINIAASATILIIGYCIGFEKCRRVMVQAVKEMVREESILANAKGL